MFDKLGVFYCIKTGHHSGASFGLKSAYTLYLEQPSREDAFICSKEKGGLRYSIILKSKLPCFRLKKAGITDISQYFEC